MWRGKVAVSNNTLSLGADAPFVPRQAQAQLIQEPKYPKPGMYTCCLSNQGLVNS